VKKWLIVQAYWYFDEITGEFHYRVHQPAKALNQRDDFLVLNVHVFHPFFPYLAEQADLLILHLLPDIEAGAAIRFRKSQNLPTLFEIADNFLDVGPWVAEGDAHRNPEIRQNMLYHAHLCDALQINNTRLKDPFESVNKNVLLYENQIDRVSDREPDTPSKAPFTIGWGGSIGHRTDLLPFLPALKEFLNAHRDSRFSYMGQSELFQELFSDFPQEQISFKESGPIDSYYDFLKTIDVGIAPLENTDFNRCRSDIKHLEFAAMGACSLLAKSPPYLEYHRDAKNALFFDTPETFLSQLEFLYNHPEERHQIASKAKAFAKSKRWHEDLVTAKVEDYRSLLKTTPKVHPVEEVPSAQNLMTYVRVGIYHMELQNHNRAEELFDNAIRQLPTYHQAHYWKRELLMRTGRDEEVLETAGSYQPSPMFEDLFIQQLASAASRTRPDRFESILEQIRDQNARFDLAPHRFNIEEILSENPYHYRTLAKLAAQCVQEGSIDDKWYSYLRWAQRIDPDNPDFKACAKLMS